MTTKKHDPQHTPGPWIWTTDNAGPENEWGCSTRGPVDMDAYECTGFCNNPELYGADGEPVISAGGGEYCPVRGATKAQLAANARLLAAAPELLHALTELRAQSTIERDWEALQQAMAKADAAIAKAKGEA